MTDGREVTLDDLVRIRGETEFLGRKVFLRTLGARQDELRVMMAMARAAEMRSALRTEGTPEYNAFILPLKLADVKTLREAGEALERGRLTRQSYSAVNPEREPEPPEGADVAEVLEAEEERRREEAKLAERRQKWVEENLEEFKKQYLYGEWDEETLRKEVLARQEELQVNAAYVARWNSATLLYGCYRDKECKKPLFASCDEVEDCSPVLRDHLLSKYWEIDRFSYDLDALKNLPRGQ